MQKKVPRPFPPTQKTRATFTVSKHLADLTRQEAIAYLEQLIDRLTKKQLRERAYLDRRAARGTHTPTDEVYEADQILEEELLALLGDLLQGAKDRTHKQ
jgi:hypothetical protein